jgi:hypothetical protein
MNLPSPAVRALAFYLPQFHPIEENNRWWGPGFTEWTNVVRARPAFAGHYQPHIPADLGFYDLRCRDTRHEQARLARAHGLHGFCYYHYWFNGKLLLERPLLDLLDDQDLDFPFCVCWANENWTRRWDGEDQQILIAQDYTAYDPDAHFAWLAPALRDPRYVRVDGRPLFLIYRAVDLPDIPGTIAAWRRAAARLGIADPYVCAMANSQNTIPLEALPALGFDAVVEFEPNLRGIPVSRTLPEAPGLHMFDYRTVAERAMAREAESTKVFPCVFPSWDNTARRGWRATVVHNEDTALYQRWLETACARTMQHGESERLVFINAWNEWAEGCHLEPDARHGRVFLEATARGLGLTVAPGPEIAPDRPAPTRQLAPDSRIDIRLPLERPIYVWGSGSAGRQVAAHLDQAGIEFRGFLDSNQEIWNRQVDGHTVQAPAPVLQDIGANGRSPFILIGSIAQDAIGADIERAGGRLGEHYLRDATRLIVRRVQRPAPGFIRLGSWPRPSCPVCLSPSSPIVDGVCQRCRSTERGRLAALVLCDVFDWAHPPIVNSAPRPHVHVLHQAADGDHLHALDGVVRYEPVSSPADAPRRDVDLIIASVAAGDDPSDWMAHASEHLATGGQLVFLAPRESSGSVDVRQWAAEYGLSANVIDRDWRRYGVGQSLVWMLGRN